MLLLSAICICLIFGGLVLFSAGIVRRALGRVPVPTRLLATMLVGMMLTTALFHALLWVGWFNRWLVSGLAVLAIAIAYFRGHSAAVELERIGRDMALLPKLLRRAWRGVYGASALVVVAAVVATASRMLILPPLAWDALTYHVVKAAMWVQAGGPLTFEAPGGWSFYKLRLAGAESFVAWAMLPSGNDLLVCALDMVWWLGTGCAVAALGCELGLRVRQRWAAVTYALFIPVAWGAVGASYVELPLCVGLIGALTFAIRYLRTGADPSLWLAIAALGLSAGMRGPIAPLAAVLCVVLGVHRLRGAQIGRVRAVAVGAGLAALPVLPWLISNTIETGYPLDVPMTIAGLRLGAENASLEWYMGQTADGYTWAGEWTAIRSAFEWAPADPTHLSMLSLVPLGVSFVGFGMLWRRQRSAAVLSILFCLWSLTAFYHPDFTVVRIRWPLDSGRFLLPVLLVALPVSLLTSRGSGLWARAYPMLLIAGAMAHIYLYAFHGWTAASGRPAAVAAGVAIVGIPLLLLAARRLGPHGRLALVSSTALALAVGVSFARDVDRRYTLIRNEFVRHPTFAYWHHAAQIVEDSPPARIAVTSSPWRDSDTWLLYHFFGSELQNTIRYVPITASGEIIPHMEGERRQDADYDRWLERLKNDRITHVWSFKPGAVELRLMAEHQARFEKLVGKPEKWGLYRVRP